jgi:hypothetical protein
MLTKETEWLIPIQVVGTHTWTATFFSPIHSQYTRQLHNSVILLLQKRPLKILSDFGLVFVGNEYI